MGFRHIGTISSIKFELYKSAGCVDHKTHANSGSERVTACGITDVLVKYSLPRCTEYFVAQKVSSPAIGTT